MRPQINCTVPVQHSQSVSTSIDHYFICISRIFCSNVCAFKLSPPDIFRILAFNCVAVLITALPPYIPGFSIRLQAILHKPSIDVHFSSDSTCIPLMQSEISEYPFSHSPQKDSPKAVFLILRRHVRRLNPDCFRRACRSFFRLYNSCFLFNLYQLDLKVQFFSGHFMVCIKGNGRFFFCCYLYRELLAILIG